MIGNPYGSGYGRGALVLSVMLYLSFFIGFDRLLADEAMFRANLERTANHKTKGLRRLSGVKWKFKTQGKVRSSPVVFDSSIYFGSNDGFLYALDKNSGNEIWKFKTKGEIYSSPTVSSGVVYFGCNEGKLYALDAVNGDLKWSYKAGGEIQSSPAVTAGVVYFGSLDSYIYAIDSTSGKLIWKFKTQRGIISSPAATSGKLIWKFKTQRGITSSPAVADEILFIGSLDNNLYSVDVKNGNELWRFKTEDIVISTPAVSDGKVFFGVQDTHLYALSVKTGELIWDSKTDGGILDWVYSFPAVSKNAVFIGGVDSVYSFNKKTGRRNWKFNTIRVVSSPSIAASILYFGSNDKNLYALDAVTGEELWRFQTRGEIETSPAIDKAVVYFGSNDGYVYALE